MEEFNKERELIKELEKVFDTSSHELTRLRIMENIIQSRIKALNIQNVSKSFTTGCEVEDCNLKVFSLTYCKHHFLTED